MRTYLLLVALAGCVSSRSITCDDGSVCPSDTVCATIVERGNQTLCATTDQVARCADKGKYARCDVGARCYEITPNGAGVAPPEACVTVACGDGFVDPADPTDPQDLGEVCDDGNTHSGDGCSDDCHSNETCGNGVTDGAVFEQCDDGNALSHDGCDLCRLEQPTWQLLQNRPQNIHDQIAIAYDDRRHEVIVLGGTVTAPSETWVWNGDGWTLRSTPVAPNHRTSAAMAYDHARARVVLFGGFDGSEDLSDTWEWDGSTWTQRNTIVTPPARFNHTMVYDAARKRIVLFGGEFIGSALDDTWEWDGTTWAEVIASGPRPPARFSAAMSYDPARGVTVLFGGSLPGAPSVADTWEYDGSSWKTFMSISQPPPRSRAAMAYDVTTHQSILFGGIDASPTSLGDQWGWDGTTWTPLAPSTLPARRSLHAMVSDPIRQKVVLVGGVPVPGEPETWEWDGASWTNHVIFSPAPHQQGGQVAQDTLRGRTVLLSQIIAVGSGNTFEFDGTSFIHSDDPVQLDRFNFAMTYEASRQRSLLFGGFDNLTELFANDTWSWDGTAWTQLAPVHAPTPRGDHAMVFDAKRARVVLFGGQDLTQTFPDMWSFDGDDWTELTPAHLPAARHGFALAYDPIREQVVLFGGASTTGAALGDTWLWDGADWTLATPALAPTARSGMQLAWDSSRRRLVMFGGGAGSQFVGDAWEWDGTTWSLLGAVSDAPSARTSVSAFSARDGVGTFAFGGTPAPGELWHLAWSSNARDESCRDAIDLDGDGLAGCDDPDCWWACSPLCPPGARCPSDAPRCGDGVCNTTLENCRLCPSDCACAPTCGDFYCDPGEDQTSCPGDCTP